MDFLPLDMWHLESRKPMADWVKRDPVLSAMYTVDPVGGHRLFELSLYRAPKFNFSQHIVEKFIYKQK